MSHSLAVALSQNPLVRAALVTLSLFVFLGAATGALPVQCLATGVAACAGPPVSRPAVVPSPSIAPPAVTATASLATPAPVPAALTLTNNEVVASTFAELNASLQAPQSPASLTTWPPAANTVHDPNTGLQTRVVPTTVIHVSDLAPPPATGTEPALNSSSSLLDPITPLAAPSAPPVVTASVTPVPSTPAALPVKPKPVVVAAALPKPVAHVATATIMGQGANVRSSPTAGNNVMFALPGGTKVSVLSDQRGWYQVRDPKGRTGWVYSDFVSKA